MGESISEIEERRVVLTESAARRISVLKEQEQAENALSADCGFGRRLLRVSVRL